MRSALITLACTALLAAACGGGGPATTTQPVGATEPPIGQTSAPQPTQAPPAATDVPPATTSEPPPATGDVATVTLTGGPDAGTYNATGNPNCSDGFVGTGVWGAQLIDESGTSELTTIQMVIPEEGIEDAHLNLSVTIGPVLSGTTYSLFDVGTGDITDNGSSAVLHINGTTDEGVTIDATVNCAFITRA